MLAMIGDNIILCKISNMDKCISNELYRIKKYYTWLLVMLDCYDEDNNSINQSQLVMVIIKIIFIFVLIFALNTFFNNYTDTIFGRMNLKTEYTRRHLHSVLHSQFFINRNFCRTMVFLLFLICLNFFFTGFLFYLRI